MHTQRFTWKFFAHHKQLWQVGNLANVIRHLEKKTRVFHWPHTIIINLVKAQL